MKKLFGLMLFLTVAAGGAASASAQDMPPQSPSGGGPGGGGMRMQFQMPSFADLDKNKDKKLSRDEMPGQFPPQAFDRLDENKDGFIDEEEWGRMRSRFGGGQGGPALGERMVKFMDANHDGKISREEFAKVEQLFDTLDSDHNGDLSQEELNGFFRAMNEAQTQATGGVDANNLFTKFDKNKDGKLTADEMTDERTFKALDLNKDGSVTREEADQSLKQMAERSRAKKQSQPSPPHN
jgi:Ca2+-binding EF-hand superfamily protein